jgi:NADP-dependent aldehyde dehydrogenase
MLTEGICRSYKAGISQREGNTRVEVLARAARIDGVGPVDVSPVLFQVSAVDLLKDPNLEKEIFGPTTLIIRYSDQKELIDLTRALEGQLTATLHGTDADIAAFTDLISILEGKAGRLIVNGYPTGPYPATSDSRHTSVGTQAIYRFVRPVCYQDFPQAALPDELKNGNPLGIFRLVDGVFTRDPL